MIDTIAVGLIVAGAIGYIVYRYVFKKSGGCSCGCGDAKGKGGSCCGSDSSPACGDRK